MNKLVQAIKDKKKEVPKVITLTPTTEIGSDYIELEYDLEVENVFDVDISERVYASNSITDIYFSATKLEEIRDLVLDEDFDEIDEIVRNKILNEIDNTSEWVELDDYVDLNGNQEITGSSLEHTGAISSVDDAVDYLVQYFTERFGNE
jgi:hypothetical protein